MKSAIKNRDTHVRHGGLVSKPALNPFPRATTATHVYVKCMNPTCNWQGWINKKIWT